VGIQQEAQAANKNDQIGANMRVYKKRGIDWSKAAQRRRYKAAWMRRKRNGVREKFRTILGVRVKI